MKHSYPSFYHSLFNWLKNQLIKVPTHERPILIGISGPQGCGKSTLTQALVELFAQEAIPSATLSIDDFYFTHQELLKLAQRFPQNPYLQQRGYPGTHDIELGLRTLSALKNRNFPILLPQYDKSKYQGQGDRHPEALWKEITQPLEILFLEGWMLGFTPLKDKSKLTQDLSQIDQFLNEYQGWYSLFDGFIHLMPLDIQFAIDWRVEAEDRMKSQGKAGMTLAEVTTYIKKFLPAYELYLPQLTSQFQGSEFQTLWKNPIQILIQKNRLPLTLPKSLESINQNS